ncbi:MAG TPA: tRNA 2-thiouridine(34) synthase MnmA [Geobacteraceae bacterium]|nr:tRNA 2-thiouridine(34) synthase MnmA [Geobacteraceae bacterium]
MSEKKRNKRVAVAMSGGVDSSVTAALLKDEGYDVVGVTMVVRDLGKPVAPNADASGAPPVPDNVRDAGMVAKQLGIPFHVVNFAEDFQRLVIDDFVAEYFHGRTPNPCARCNQRIKFGLLLKKARELDADYLATGHYVRKSVDDTGRCHLLKGMDEGKDQSYFLFSLTQEQLAETLFPLGGMTKREVRLLAAGFGLPVADKGESQEICFIPDNDYVRFIEEERGKACQPGNIVDCRGNVLGRHNGAYRFTIGQRKGLGVAHAHPLYVLGVDMARNEVTVGGKDELTSEGLMAAEVNWIAPAPDTSVEAACKIRYRHRPVACTIVPLAGDRAQVRFHRPEQAVTPGQAVVFYDGDEVLGGGWIE